METALTALGFSKDVIAWIIKFVQPKIEITPKKVNVGGTEWKQEGYFTVCNKTDKPLFDTQIMLWLSVETITPPPIQVTKIDGQENDKELKIRDISVNSGAFILTGIVSNKGVMLIQLQYLAPNTCRRIFFSTTEQSTGSVTLQAVATSKDPSQTLRGANKVAMQFTPPKNFNKITSVSFKINEENN